jgi:ABC-type phosphate/phosphonate transport system substrate-binding protein
MHWIASLPMYNVAPALAADWRALLNDVHAELSPWLDARGDTLSIVDAGSDLPAFWLRDDLLLSQTCGYPLLHALDGRVNLVATPSFDAPGCSEGTYRSALVVGAHVEAASLEACRGLRAVYNDDDSNSGMNLLRHAVAPFARDGRFFGSVRKSGGHLASLRAIAVEKSADIAAIDCVTLAFVRDHLPELAAGVREIGMTASTAALPFIASKKLSGDAIDTLRRGLAAALKSDEERARRLRLKDFLRPDLTDYASILDIERDAISRGYPRLA